MPSTLDRFVLERRSARPRHDPFRHQGLLVEDEPGADGRLARVATVFLTGRECPWRCTMCDLWKFTIAEDTPAGAIPRQLDDVREQISGGGGPAPSGVKLYNAGSFFDPRAVPEGDYDAIAARLDVFSRVIVESHPALVGARVDRFRDALGRHRAKAAPAAALEVAMGLETAHPDALERLNKKMTRGSFRAAAEALRERDVALRVFLLAPAPFVPEREQEEWILRSLDFAFDCGAAVVSLVPLRSGNGALEALIADGRAAMPTLGDLESWFAAALARAGARGRVFLDLWDVERFREEEDFAARGERLRRMNRAQRLPA